jgi:hypothetical protein
MQNRTPRDPNSNKSKKRLAFITSTPEERFIIKALKAGFTKEQADFLVKVTFDYPSNYKN